MNDSLDVSTIIFAALAVFIVWKLKSVLGTRTGDERPPFNPFARRGGASDPAQARSEGGKVVSLPVGRPSATRSGGDAERWKGIADPDSALANDLDRIAAADASFSGRSFLDGAKAAYEMILAAYAKGDRAALAGLLAKDVLDGFVAAIDTRDAEGETLTHAMVAFDSARIEHAQLSGKVAQVTVRYESQQINTARDRQGTVRSGTDRLGLVTDTWTFSRTVSARDPNWTLVATDAE